MDDRIKGALHGKEVVIDITYDRSTVRKADAAGDLVSRHRRSDHSHGYSWIPELAGKFDSGP
jgi:hypothetical protein